MRRRIAFIDYFPPHYRVRLYEELARRMEVDFYFYSDESERWHNPELKLGWEGDFRVIPLRRLRVGGQALAPRVAIDLSGRRYDAVVKNLNGKLMLPLTMLTARTRGVPFVLWTGMWHHPRTAVHRATRWLTESVYRSAGAIVAYGDHVKRYLGDVRGVEPDKIYVAGQAVDGRRFQNGRPGLGDNVLFIGQFKEMKGISYLLDAYERVNAGHEVKLRVVGNGPLESLIRDRAERLPGIELVGHVPQERLPDELAAARCLVLPSVTTDVDREPWGLVVNEAMHAGVPVVATDAVGAAAGGLVRDGINGIVVPERDPVALAEGLGSVVADRELAERLGAAARNDVAAFNYDRMADAFEAAVEHAAARA